MRGLAIVGALALVGACAESYSASPAAGGDGGAVGGEDGGAPGPLRDGGGGPSLDSGGGSPGDAGGGGPTDPCAAVTCGENARCDSATGQCRCVAGFTSTAGGACVAPAPGTPLSHSRADVCARWIADHQGPAGAGWTAGATTCDPGTLTRGAIDDAVVRMNLYRWLEGLAPAVDDPAGATQAMQCATVGAWNPPGVVPNPHAPPQGSKCWTAGGAAGAGSSNMAWGSGSAAGAMDQWVQDTGNDTTFGHRRWILHPPLGRSAIGFYAGGGPYGAASCMSCFDSSGGGPAPDWLAFPPEGFAPTEIVNWTWTVHLRGGDPSAGALTVVRASDGATLPMTKLPLQQGYGYPAVAFRQSGWQAKAGDVFRVSFTGAGAPLSWEVKAVDCP